MKMNMIIILVTIIILIFLLRKYEIRIKGYLGEWYVSKKLNKLNKRKYKVINNLLLNLHLISNPIPWLTDPTWARVALIIVNIWLGFPYMMNVCLGALGAIPDSYYEAADVDGASKWLQFRKITLPSLAQISYPLLICI